jgi:hypothetical protein
MHWHDQDAMVAAVKRRGYGRADVPIESRHMVWHDSVNRAIVALSVVSIHVTRYDCKSWQNVWRDQKGYFLKI